MSNNNKIYDLKDTWNDINQTFTGIKLSVSDINSKTDSDLMDMSINGSSKLNLDKFGNLTVSSLTVPFINANNSYGAIGTALKSGGSVNSLYWSSRGLSIHVADYGAVGDNVTDDYANIVAAISDASSKGIVLEFDGTKTYKINQDTLTIPQGLNVRTNGCTFNFTKSVTSNITPAIRIFGPCIIDKFKVTIPVNTSRCQGILATGNSLQIGELSLISANQQTQSTFTYPDIAAYDYGIKVSNGSLIDIKSISCVNYDRAVVIDTTNDTKIGGVNITSYVRGLWTVDNINLSVGASNIKVRSPTTTILGIKPGQNGLLTTSSNNQTTPWKIQNQENVTFIDFIIENSGEHGIRVGGGPQRNIKLIRPKVYDATSCGIKLLGTNNITPSIEQYHQNILIDSPVIEDCGYGARSADNLCGILIERLNKLQLDNPIIRNRTANNSAYFGISIFGSSDVTITSPMISDVTAHGLRVATTKLPQTPKLLQGRVSTVSTSNIVIGNTSTSNTQFIIDLSEDDYIQFENGTIRQVASIVNNSILQLTQNAGVTLISNTYSNYFYSTTTANISSVFVNGGSISNCGSDGISFSASLGSIINNVRLNNVSVSNNASRGFAIASSGTGSAFTDCIASIRTSNNGTFGYVQDPGWIINGVGSSNGVSLETIAADDSSTWSDGSDFYYRKAQVWSSISSGSFTQLSTTRTNVTAPVASDGNIFSGTYTPTMTAISNLDSYSSPMTFQYMRVANTVTVSGVASLDATNINTDTILEFTLPVPSNIGSVYHISGTAVSGATGNSQVGAISANTTSNNARLKYQATRTDAVAMYLQFTYRIN